MDRIRYIVSAPLQHGGAGLVELRAFKLALACDNGVISAALQSYCSRTLHLSFATDDAALILRVPTIELLPGTRERIRIGLRLGALQVERAFCLVLREVLAPRRDASFLPIEMRLPLIVSPLSDGAARRAA